MRRFGNGGHRSLSARQRGAKAGMSVHFDGVPIYGRPKATRDVMHDVKRGGWRAQLKTSLSAAKQWNVRTPSLPKLKFLEK